APRDVVLPQDVVVAVQADLEAGRAYRPHLGCARAPDVRTGQKRAVEQRARAVVRQHRGACDLAQKAAAEDSAQGAPGVVRSDAEEKGGLRAVALEQPG